MIRAGGGVLFMIRKGIEFEIVNDIDKFVVEALCIKVKVNNDINYSFDKLL